MAVMTLSEARAALPDVVNRVSRGEEVTITRYGRPMAVVVRPDVVWSRPGEPGAEAVGENAAETAWLIATLRERARRHQVTLAEELSALLAAAEAAPADTGLPPIELTTVRSAAASTWPREEIYADERR
jgi:antitoxin (DNA-binding transcriptional repressor) of toxin-antitoxin stability system